MVGRVGWVPQPARVITPTSQRVAAPRHLPSTFLAPPSQLGVARLRAAFAGAAGPHPVSEVGKPELTEAPRLPFPHLPQAGGLGAAACARPASTRFVVRAARAEEAPDPQRPIFDSPKTCVL